MAIRTRLLLFTLILGVVAGATAQSPCSKTAVNAPPRVNDDYYPWPPPAVLNVLANDADVDLDPITIQSVSLVTGGTATISADRKTIAFTPASGATAGSLVYSVSDGINLASTGNVVMSTDAHNVNFTSACSGPKCTFTVEAPSRDGARWFSWDFGDGTSRSNWTGFNIFKEYTLGLTETLARNVTLTVDYMDGSRGMRTNAVNLAWPPLDVQYRIFEGPSTVVVNDIVPMSIRVEFLSSTFPTSSSNPQKRYRYSLSSSNAVPAPNEFSGTSLDGRPVGSMVSMQFNAGGITDLSIFVQEQQLSSNNIWVYTGSQWYVGRRNIQVVDKPPTVVIHTPTVNADGTVLFNPNNSYDDRGITPAQFSFSWDFGDGDYAPGVISSDGLLQSITHQYRRPGRFTTYLTLTDRVTSQSTTGSASATIANRAPQSAFTFSCAGLTCSFDGTGSTDEEDLARYDWGFGDSGGAVGDTAARTFAAPGCYQVDLIVTDNAGVQNSTRRTVSVSNQQLAPTSNVAVDAHAKGGVTRSNLNGILEPGEIVLAEPSRTNSIGEAAMTAQLMGWSGNGLAGTYTSQDAFADYGMTPFNTKTNCWATGDCFAVSVDAPSTGRPQLHWDGALTEFNSVMGSRMYPVHIGNSFADVPVTSPFYHDVEAVLHWGITTGCGGNSFCPGPATRRQFVVMLMRARSARTGAQPPDCNTAPFNDVPCGDITARYILEAKNAGITNGCGNGNFCPESTLTRAEAATFLVRSLGVTTPPPCTQTFADVQCADSATKFWAADFISEIYRRGISNGCSVNPLNFCPNDAVRRDQAATFLVRAFGLDIAFPQCPRGTQVVGASANAELVE